MEIAAYQSYLALKQEEHESLCRMCGECCGVSNDPCEHLEKTSNDFYACRIYNNRTGLHKTSGGNEFNCVPINELIRKEALPHGCAYSKVKKT